MFKKETIKKIINQTEALIEIADLSELDNTPVMISGPNSKVPCNNVNLPPVYTCSNCGGCMYYCYAIKSYVRFEDVRINYTTNYIIFKKDPDRYFNEISLSCRTQSFFRWHSSGDIVNMRYFEGMIQVARENKNCLFLAFTKNDFVVNTWLDKNGGKLPKNLKIIFSYSPDFKPYNPYKLPECHINFENVVMNTLNKAASKRAFKCNGENCGACMIAGVGCWFLKKGQKVLIDEH